MRTLPPQSYAVNGKPLVTCPGMAVVGRSIIEARTREPANGLIARWSFKLLRQAPSPFQSIPYPDLKGGKTVRRDRFCGITWPRLRLSRSRQPFRSGRKGCGACEPRLI